MASQAARQDGGGANDLTTGPIARTLMLFALPTLGANILQSMNGSINAVWIGRFLGESALAAASNVNLIMFLMFSLGFGFSMATTILVGQSVGARDPDGARRALGTGIGLFAGLSLVIAAIGWFSAPALLHLLATPPEAKGLALAYLRVIFLAMPSMFLFVLLTTALRGFGDSITPLRFSVLAVVLDAGLNPLLIRGFGPFPRMGIAGAATATLIANSVALIGLVVYAYARDLPIRLRGPEWRYLTPDPGLLRTILFKGFPMGLQMLVMTFAGLFLIGLVNRAGVDVTAAYGAVQQLFTYLQMPAMAVGAAVSAMAAQNIGAGLLSRVDRITWAGIAINTGMTGITMALLLMFDRPALTLFLGPDSPAIPIARHLQLISCWSFLLFGLVMILFSTVRANGAVGWPLAIMAVGLLGIRVPFAWILLPRYGLDMIWWSFPVGSFATLLMALVYYRYGGWRRMGIISRTVAAEAEEQAHSSGEPAGRLKPAA